MPQARLRGWARRERILHRHAIVILTGVQIFTVNGVTTHSFCRDDDGRIPIADVEALPQFGRWDAFRETHGAAYIGLTLPRYMLRAPYRAQGGRRQIVEFEEKVRGPQDYLWGNAAVLFARNMVRSFQASGWCQHIAGPLGGGLVKGLPVHMVMHHGQEELQPPVETAIPDYRELQLAGAGFIPLIRTS